MSKFVVTIFPDQRKAYEGVHALKELHAEGSVTLYGFAVVQRDADGRLSVKDEADRGPLGTAVGALVGALVGVVGGPVGVLVGLGGGAMLGSLGDLYNLGVSEDFVDDVSRYLTPGSTAVIAELSEEWVTPLDIRMEAIGGIVIREMRDDFVDHRMERSLDAHKTDLEQRKAERAANKAEKMEAKLAKSVNEARQKLKDDAERARTRLDKSKAEADAKLQALQEQAAKATPDARRRIEDRIARARADYDHRMGHLKQAWDQTQEALRG